MTGDRPDTYEAIDELVDTDPLRLRDEAWRLLRERDALAAALADIAGGECWQTHCPDGDLCDVCTARKALGTLP